MTDVTPTADDLNRLAAATTAWRTATTESANCDLWLAAGNELDDVVEQLLDRLRAPGTDTPPTFPHAIANPCEVWVYMDPRSPDAAKYVDGRVAMGCESLEHAEVMFSVDTLTPGFPHWVRVVLVQRADGGRPATVLAQHTRDTTVTTWRRPAPSGS